MSLSEMNELLIIILEADGERQLKALLIIVSFFIKSYEETYKKQSSLYNKETINNLSMSLGMYQIFTKFKKPLENLIDLRDKKDLSSLDIKIKDALYDMVIDYLEKIDKEFDRVNKLYNSSHALLTSNHR